MSWESDLFDVLDDLEAEAQSTFAREREAEVVDRGRAEYAQVTLASRLAASVDAEVTLAVHGVGRLQGVLARVNAEWVLVEAAGQSWMVRTAALTGVGGASERSVPEVAWSPLQKLGIGSALRRLAEAGERCGLLLVDGSRCDGVPERVGSDFVEVRPDGESPATVLVPFAALAAVHSRE